MVTFEDFLTTQSYQVPVIDFLINLILTAFLAFIISQTYIRYGKALSNRKMFAKNFFIIAMTTMFIITVVKSSLALSLGLVGALSIIRFRTAIKEPEELAFLFLVIALGLGLGADQRIITIFAILTILSIIIIRNKFNYDSKNDQSLNLRISSSGNDKVDLNQMVSILNKHCSSVNLKRFDEANDMLEATFLANFNDFSHLEMVRNEFNDLSKSMRITFLDYQEPY